jgi:hypothetical protein
VEQLVRKAERKRHIMWSSDFVWLEVYKRKGRPALITKLASLLFSNFHAAIGVSAVAGVLLLLIPLMLLALPTLWVSLLLLASLLF